MRGRGHIVWRVAARVEYDSSWGVDTPRQQVARGSELDGAVLRAAALEELHEFPGALLMGAQREVGVHCGQDGARVAAEGAVGPHDLMGGILEEAQGLERVEHELGHLRGEADLADALDDGLNACEVGIGREAVGGGLACDEGGRREPEPALGGHEVVLEAWQRPAGAPFIKLRAACVRGHDGRNGRMGTGVQRARARAE